MEKLLGGKVAIVTGGSRGIGKGIGLSLAKSGADLAIIYSSIADSRFPKAIDDTLKQIHKYANVVSYDCDLSNLNKSMGVIDSIKKTYGRLDIFVNDAAFSPFISLEDTTPELWDKIFSVNIKTPFFISKYVSDLMKKNNRDECGFRGSIINISSISSSRGGNSHPYCAAKSAIESITKTLALEFSKYGIRVNAIAPGLIDTDLSRESLQFYSPKQIKTLYGSIPLRRPGFPEEIGNMAIFLASNQLSSYITGAIIPINGGWDIPIPGDEGENR